MLKIKQVQLHVMYIQKKRISKGASCIKILLVVVGGPYKTTNMILIYDGT